MKVRVFTILMSFVLTLGVAGLYGCGGTTTPTDKTAEECVGESCDMNQEQEQEQNQDSEDEGENTDTDEETPDTDNDGTCDDLDFDDDGDGVTDSNDNCPLVPNAGQADFDGDEIGDVCDPEPGKGNLLGNFKWTFYWIEYESAYTGPQNVAVYDAGDAGGGECPLHIIAYVRSDFYYHIDQNGDERGVTVEGTGYLLDGTMINLVGEGADCSCSSFCFTVVDTVQYPYGMGSENNPLHPWRSVASNDQPHGKKLYVEDLDGITLPDISETGFDPATEGFEWDDSCNCFRHDGCVVVEDTGWSFGGSQLDFFSLKYDAYQEIGSAMNWADPVKTYENSPKCP